MKNPVRLLGLVILIPLMILGGCQTAKKPAPSPAPTPKQNTQTSTAATLMELAGKDPYTEGCVSCHKKEKDVDRSLPAYVKRIGGHPEVRESTVNACYFCHEAQKNYSLYKRFYQGLHRAHWQSDIFYSKLKGQCFSCHSVEKNGVSGIKNYPLAGYRSGTAQTGGTQKAAPSNETTQEKKSGTTTEQKTESNQRGQQNKSTPKAKTGTDELPTPTP